MKTNLYHASHSFAGPYEKGTCCVSSYNMGYVIAKNLKEAEKMFRQKVTIPTNHVIAIYIVRRSPKNRQKMQQQMNEYSQTITNLTTQIGTLYQWLHPNDH